MPVNPRLKKPQNYSPDRIAPITYTRWAEFKIRIKYLFTGRFA